MTDLLSILIPVRDKKENVYIIYNEIENLNYELGSKYILILPYCFLGKILLKTKVK